MKAIICGGRDYEPIIEDYIWLDSLHKKYSFTEIITGGARGADNAAAQWAREVGIKSTVMPANWNTYGRAAGPRRNTEMLEYAGPGSMTIAFPGGKGTAHMVLISKQRGRTVIERIH